MTVLSVVQQASSVLGLAIPSTLFSQTDRTSVEIQYMINFCAKQLLDEYAWERLLKRHVLIGDAVTEAFDLPADYDRMTVASHFWSNQMPFWNGVQIGSLDEWIAIEATGFIAMVTPIWIIFGGQIHVIQPLGTGETLTYPYVSNLIVRSQGSTSPVGDKPEFTEDTDSFIIDERVLRTCFVYNWKLAKGFDYSSELQELQNAFSYAVGKDKGPRVIREGVSNRLWAGLGGSPWPFGGTL